MARRRARRTGAALVDERQAYTLRFLAAAVGAYRDADEALGDAVLHARMAGNSWRAIGEKLGVTGEAVRKGYGDAVDEVLRANDLDVPND